MPVPVAFAPVAYGLMNIASATGIVFANKAGERAGELDGARLSTLAGAVVAEQRSGG